MRPRRRMQGVRPLHGGWSRALRAGLPLALALLGGAAAGADPAATGTPRSRPGRGTPVTAAIYLNDVAQVDDARQQATVDLALRLTWRDPRLAGRFPEPTLVDPGEIWRPRLAILNDRGLEPGLPDHALVLPDGTIRVVQGWVGDVAFPTNLAEFPFDRQALGISVLFLTLPGEAEISIDRSLPLAAPGLRCSRPRCWSSSRSRPWWP